MPCLVAKAVCECRSAPAYFTALFSQAWNVRLRSLSNDSLAAVLAIAATETEARALRHCVSASRKAFSIAQCCLHAAVPAIVHVNDTVRQGPMKLREKRRTIGSIRDTCAPVNSSGRCRVMCSEPLARFRGLAGRPGEAVPGFSGLYIAGDWVGSHWLLSDAVAASGRLAGELAAAFAQKNRPSSA